MAETLGTLPPDPTDAAPNYRPLSGLAVAAILVSGAFAVTVTVLGLTALVSHRPALAPWALGLGVGGLVLAIAAGFQIRRSEGTRAGQGLARAAMWLSVLFIVGYGAYYAAFDYAVRTQSRDCIEPYLTELRDAGDPGRSPAERDKALKRAFMWTLLPAQRQGLTPETIEQRFETAFSTFRKGELIRLLERSGGQVRIEDTSVKDWSVKGTGYEVTEFATIRTPEGRFELMFTLQAIEGPGAAGRQWNVVPMPNSPFRTVEPTALGAAVLGLVNAAGQVGRQWEGLLRTGDTTRAYPMILAPEHRERVRAEVEARRSKFQAVQRAALLADPLHLYSNMLWPPNGIAAEAVNPGYFRFLNGQRPDGEPWLVIPDTVAPPGQREATARLLMLPGGIVFGQPGATGPQSQPYPTFEADAFRVDLPMSLSLVNRQAPSRLLGWLTVETHDPELLKTLRELREQGLSLPLVSSNSPELPVKPAWQIQRLTVYEEAAGPPGQGMPPPPTRGGMGVGGP